MFADAFARNSRRCAGPLFAALLILPAALGGCSTSAPRPSTPAAPAGPALVPIESGFLKDYSQLKASEQFADLKIYRDDSRKGGYRRLLFRPVEVWRGADRRLEDISEEDLQYLADALYQAVEKRLRQSFEMVGAPGPGVLEIHLAFSLVTEPEQSIDFFSTAVPVKDLSRREGALFAATRRFVNDCALEAEFVEVTGRTAAGPKGKPIKSVRAAFFDARRGSATPKGEVASWEGVHAVFEKWAGVLDERLESLRDGTFKPRLTVKEEGKPAAR